MMVRGVVFDAEGVPQRTVRVPEGELQAQAGPGETVIERTAAMTDVGRWRLVDGQPIELEG